MKKKDNQAFKCEGATLDILRAYDDEVQSLIEDHDTLHKEFNERATKQKKVHESRLYELWTDIAMRLGLDPEKTWRSPEYQVETSYLREGFGAIVYTPAPPSNNLSLQLLGKGEETEKEVALIETPDKAKFH